MPRNRPRAAGRGVAAERRACQTTLALLPLSVKLFLTGVTPLEYAAHRGFAHLGRQFQGVGARIACQMQSIDELRHTYSANLKIAFVDDDDIWMPEKIEKQLKAMQDQECLISCTEGLFGRGAYDSSNDYPRYNSQKYFGRLSNYKDWKRIDYVSSRLPLSLQ